MYELFTIITDNNNLTEEMLDERLAKYTYDADVPEFFFKLTSAFSRRFEFASRKEAMEREREYLNSLADEEHDEEFNQFIANSWKRLECLEKGDLAGFIELEERGIYRVEGDKVYCHKNIHGGMFEFCTLGRDKKWCRVLTQGGAVRRKCKVSNWNLLCDNGYYSNRVYDWETDTWFGKRGIDRDEEEQKDWEERYAQMIRELSNDNSYVYAAAYHF